MTPKSFKEVGGAGLDGRWDIKQGWLPVRPDEKLARGPVTVSVGEDDFGVEILTKALTHSVKLSGAGTVVWLNDKVEAKAKEQT